MSKVTLIIDLQFGSTGKGLIAGYLAERDKHDTVINANMPNAGHTYINDKGRTWIHKVLPNGIVSPNLKNVMIGPQSVFSLDQLKREVLDSRDLLKGRTIYIHDCAVVLSDSHREAEQKQLSGISSTMQGSMAAAVSKMERNPERDHRAATSAELAKYIKQVGISLNVRIVLSNSTRWLNVLRQSDNILAEGAQGYSLGINAGFWPYCTSRDCTPARFLADMAIPLDMPLTIVGTARVHPIRVGNTPDGYSGDVYSDQTELTWEDVGQKAELTTVTQRERRIFTFSEEQMDEAIAACTPTEIFMNFCNYDPDSAALIVAKYDKWVRYIGFGPKRGDVKDIKEIERG